MPDALEIKHVSRNPRPYILIQFEADEESQEVNADYVVNGLRELYLENNGDKSLDEKKLGELLCMLGESLMDDSE